VVQVIVVAETTDTGAHVSVPSRTTVAAAPVAVAMNPVPAIVKIEPPWTEGPETSVVLNVLIVGRVKSRITVI
jgi:hypothetical protein